MARILIVEDNLEMLEILRLALVSADHEVVVADGGQEGIDAFNRQQFALVITDIVMPGVDGLDFVKAVRATDKGIKVIAISGGGSKMDAAYALNVADVLGADFMLYKPFELDALLEMVRALLES